MTQDNMVEDTGRTTVDADVVIAGAGPVGLILAGELRLAGVEVLVVERRAGEATRQSPQSRAGGPHPRTMEILDQRGLLDRFLPQGHPAQMGSFSLLPLDFSHFPTRYPYTLVIQQFIVERLLAQWATDLGVPVLWSTEVTGLAQDDTGVDVQVRGPERAQRLRARYLVGCDGGHSTVRDAAGFAFPGTPATLSAIVGDVELDDPPPPTPGMVARRFDRGDVAVIVFEPGWYRLTIVDYDQASEDNGPVSVEELRQTLVRIAGTDYGLHSPRWISRATDASRQATHYRQGRVLLAGDAAHIHYAISGQGMNTGLQDAVNLGWKLASVINGHTPAELLDTYHAERHPVGKWLLLNTRAQGALARHDPHTDALRETVGTLIEQVPGVHDYLAGLISGLSIHYPTGQGYPLLGYRVPDLDLDTSAGAFRLFTLLHAARPVLLDLTGGDDLATTAQDWADRITIVHARCEDDRWRIPGLGEIAAPAALLIRPDGYIAWAAASADEPDTASGLTAALHHWCGAPTATTHPATSQR